MGKAKYLLLFAVAALILIGLSYARAALEGFKDFSLSRASLIEFLPDECKVMETSRGVVAGIEFNRDRLGNINDKTYIHLATKYIYAGANAAFRITAQNISSIPLTVDQYKLEIENSKSYLAKAIYFSGKVKIYRGNGQYYDILGTFSGIGLTELADNLTAIMKYRKIDVMEKLVLELNQQFEKDITRYTGTGSLSYKLEPVFIQYFPKSDESLAAEK